MAGLKIPGLKEGETRIVIIVFAASLLIAVGIVAFVNFGQAKIKHEVSKVATAAKGKFLAQDSATKLSGIDIEANKIAASDKSAPLQNRIAHLIRVAQSEPNDRGAQLDLGTCLISAGEYDSAVDVLSSMHATSTGDSIDGLADTRLSLAMYRAGRVSTAAVLIDSCNKKYPAIAEGWCIRGEIEMALDLTSDSAEAHFRKALTIDDNYPEGLYQISRWYMLRPKLTRLDVQKAGVALGHLLSIEPMNGKALGRMGMVCQYLGRRDESRKYYESALSINPDDFTTHYNLGVLLADQFADPAGALIQFLAVLKLKSDHLQANFRIGLICLSNNTDKEAAQYFRKALSSDPRNVRAMLQLGVAYEKLGLKSDALNVYHSVVAIDPLNDIALHKLEMLAGT